MQMTPIVAAVPNDVPISTDTKQLSKNTVKIKADGTINFEELYIIIGIVPAPRHTAVMIPISKNTSKIFFTVRIPSSDIWII